MTRIVYSHPPILEHHDSAEPSLFTAEAMLSLARERKGLLSGTVPPVCVLDPDGDLERHLKAHHGLRESSDWACFHTHLGLYEHQEKRFGIIGRAVGAAFSVLLAEQLFASGCRLLISISSAGQIADNGPPPYFIVIDRALRDEGTSYHYLAPSRYADADSELLARVLPALAATGLPLHVGASWTTDAPFRETSVKVARRRAEGILAVEMEAAGLYAFAAARQKPVLCLAQVTNQLGCVPGDFEKGLLDGAEAALRLIAAVAGAWEKKSAAARVFPALRCIRLMNASGTRMFASGQKALAAAMVFLTVLLGTLILCRFAYAQEAKPPGMGLAEAASRRFPQPVRVGDLLHRQVLQPMESRPALGRVRQVVKQADGSIDVVVDYGGVLGFFTRPIAVPVDAMVLLGRAMEIADFKPEQLDKFGTFDGSGTTPLPPDSVIKVGLARPSH